MSNPKSPISKLLNFTFSPFSSPTRSILPSPILPTELLKNEKEFKIEEINTGGCGIDPTYGKGRNSKRSRSLIRRSSKKLKNQVPTVTNTDDCTIC